MKRFCLLFLALSLILCGCAQERPLEKKQYDATFLSLFDTVTTIVGQAESKESFAAQAQKIHDELLFYHELFDIYNNYPGVNNLKTVNDNAGLVPVTVDPILLELLTDCKTYYDLTGGMVNVAMGSVLQLWHEARNAGINDPANAKLPDQVELMAAAEHINLDALVIDKEASTVYISDPLVRLDVGAVGKGWAVQKVAQNAPEGLLISVGGNVCATGPKNAEGTPWVIGIQDPKTPGANLHTIYVRQESVVTSGDYQRTYQVAGRQYHHIIDPQTQMPATHWCSVSIVCADSGLADALSTALFLLPLEQGKALAEKCGVEAFWVNAAGEEFMTSGFETILRT